MRIAIFGAQDPSGAAWSQKHTIAATRSSLFPGQSHPTTRPPPKGVVHRVADASSLRDVVDLIKHVDLVISATRPQSGRECELLTTTRTLLTAASTAALRLLIIGGASSLVVPGTEGQTLLDSTHYLPAEAVPIAKACARQFEICQNATGVAWSYLSPPAEIREGTRTGKYQLGTDELILHETGESFISHEDLAVAALDEAETPRHLGTRFTVGY